MFPVFSLAFTATTVAGPHVARSRTARPAGLALSGVAHIVPTQARTP